jgi:hypothetical protein
MLGNKSKNASCILSARGVSTRFHSVLSLKKTGNGVRPRILLLHSWAHFARLSIELLSSGGSSSLDGGILVLLFPFIVGTLITRGILPAQAGDCQAESKRKLRNSPLEFVHLPDFA